MVRVNDFRSAYFVDDLSAVVCVGVTVLNIPKVEDPSEMRDASAALLKLERERNIEEPITILPTIESPRGLRLAHAIAESDPRITGLQLGFADLFEPLGIRRDDNIAAHQVRLQLRLAAGEAGVPCFDCAFPNFADTEGFTKEAATARSLGFAGKSCIHPSQVATSNRVFSPTAEEIALSLRIVEAARDAARSGVGAFALDGRMVDEPFVKRAESVLQFAKRMGRQNIDSE